MVVPKFLVAAVAALNVVGIHASPCKVSSTSELSSSTLQVTPTSESSSTSQLTPTTSEASTTPQVTSTASGSSTTSGVTPTTTPSSTSEIPSTTTTTSSVTPTTTPSVTPTTTPSATPTTCSAFSLKTPSPDNTVCGGYGHSLNIDGFIEDVFESMTLEQCAQTCEDYQGCIFFGWNPGAWCELWSEYPERDAVQTTWSWYDMSCFNLCDETIKIKDRAVNLGRAEEGGVLPASFYQQDEEQ